MHDLHGILHGNVTWLFPGFEPCPDTTTVFDPYFKLSPVLAVKRVPGNSRRHRGDLGMNDDNPSAVDPFGAIADEFVEAYRQGKRPPSTSSSAAIPHTRTPSATCSPPWSSWKRPSPPTAARPRETRTASPLRCPPPRPYVNWAITSFCGRWGVAATFHQWVGYDQVVKVWEVGTWREIQTLRGFRGNVSDLLFSNDGKTLVAASSDRTLRSWGKRPANHVLGVWPARLWPSRSAPTSGIEG